VSNGPVALWNVHDFDEISDHAHSYTLHGCREAEVRDVRLCGLKGTSIKEISRQFEEFEATQGKSHFSHWLTLNSIINTLYVTLTAHVYM
jgi:hypothetical protein